MEKTSTPKLKREGWIRWFLRSFSMYILAWYLGIVLACALYPKDMGPSHTFFSLLLESPIILPFAPLTVLVSFVWLSFASPIYVISFILAPVTFFSSFPIALSERNKLGYAIRLIGLAYWGCVATYGFLMIASQ